MSIPNVTVRRRGGDLFEKLSSEGRMPAKIVPIRFPIAEETYDVVQAINEPMGMVERYILEAICEFGPCSSDDIAGLLSLDQSLIADMISGLIKAEVDIDQNGAQFSAGQSLRASIKDQRLAKRVRHRRTFVVNPLTGDLLPINFIDNSDRWLVPFVTENEEVESSDWLRVRMGDRAISGSSSLASVLLSTDTEDRVVFGIPEGGISIIDDACLDRKLYSVLAFAVVTQESNIEVYSAVDFSIPLSDEDTSGLDYWNQVCHDIQPWVFAQPRTIDEVAEFFAQNLDGVECRAMDATTLAVSVQEPDEALVVDSRNEPSDSGAMNMLQMDLVNGWYWNVSDFRIVRVVAGDAETESRLVVLRAVAKLRELFRSRTPADTLTLVDWWEGFKTNSSFRFCAQKDIQSIDFDRFLAEAEKVPDTPFLDWLDDASSTVGG